MAARGEEAGRGRGLNETSTRSADTKGLLSSASWHPVPSTHEDGEDWNIQAYRNKAFVSEAGDNLAAGIQNDIKG